MEANKEQIQIIPAQPGWYTVVPVIGENNIVEELYKKPIIAWCMTVEAMPEVNNRLFIDPIPITCEGNDECEMLERPDGTFTSPGVEYYKSEADVIEYFQNEEKRSIHGF